jgi:pimeloyl-ACP methyl ester carboxylesterase
MTQYFLTEIITHDNLILHGIFRKPEKAGKTAVLWLHGLGSTFHNHIKLFEIFSDQLAQKRIGFAAFNTRGAGLISGSKKFDPADPQKETYVQGGAGQEKFEECVYDIDSGISFLINQGFSRVILAGHSTGANKVCYFAGTKTDKRVAGVILIGPMSDRLGEEKANPKLPTLIRKMHLMIDKGKEHFLVSNLTYFPLTPERFLSLNEKGSIEDVFDYGEKKPSLKYFSRITQPLLVVLSELDEHADRPIGDIKHVFDTFAKSKIYDSVVIGGAPHGLDGREKEFAQEIIGWISHI